MRSTVHLCVWSNSLLPPCKTDLAGAGATHGAPLKAFSDTVFAQLPRGEAVFIGFGPTDSPEFRNMREVAEPFFKSSAARFPVSTYSAG